MSETIVDMPKVTQMLDAGWHVKVFKNQMGSYLAQGHHPNFSVWARAKEGVLGSIPEGEIRDIAEDADWGDIGTVCTDDFTPEQALTRLAYKVHGEII